MKNPTNNPKKSNSNQNPNPEKNNPPELLPLYPETYTISAAARALNCSPRHVSRMLDSKEIPQFMDLRQTDSPRQMIRVPRHALLAYMQKRLN